MAHPVLDRYHLPGLAEITPLGNGGGFSGTKLWRARCLTGAICLRAWPEGEDPNHLHGIHTLMARARHTGLDFVPCVYATITGENHIVHDGRLWDLTEWMPGIADFHSQPSTTRLANACTALASLHRTWADEDTGTGTCPGVVRRLDRVRKWQTLVASGWRPDFARHAAAPWHDWARRAWPIVQARVPEIPARLASWLDVSLPVQPCLCDIWHDHVLYSGDTVTGLVDYGSVKMDHIAVDLARLLGSLVADDVSMRAVGLDAYGRITPIDDSTARLIHVLDESGTVLGGANWLMWLYHEQRSFADPEGVAQRIRSLVRRMQGW